MIITEIINTFSNAWSWWWHTDDQARLVLSSIIGFLAVVWIFLFFIKKSNNNLPPGPKGLPLLGNLLSLDPQLHTHFTKLAKTYGPIYTLKLGKRTGIVISSPALAKQVLKDQDTTFANRDVPLAGLVGTYGGSDIVCNPYGPVWRMLRKVCVREMLSSTNLDSVYGLRRREFRRMVNYLYNKAGSPVNVGEQFFLTVLNVITSMMWGGTLKGEERAVLGAEFRQVVEDITTLLGMPNVSDFFPVLARFDIQGIVKKMEGLVKVFDGIFEAIIDQRLRMNEKDKDDHEESNDFLQILLRLIDDGGDANTPFTMTHLKALLMNMVVAGTETTSNTVEYALAEMMNRPEILKKAQQELETVVGNDSIVEESHISKLPYLYSVMKEVLRLHSPLPLSVPHSPSATTDIGGYTVPKGACVFINVWAMHRDPTIWENPLEFCPDRFCDGKWDYSGNDFNYFPFGSGRRMCAGIAMAERMFMYSLASLLHSFDWSLPPGETLDLSEKFSGIVLKKKTPLVAIPTPRLSKSSLYE
ncbi:hypothetical protein ACS0TY_001340 [Phlomoides rotata]